MRSKWILGTLVLVTLFGSVIGVCFALGIDATVSKVDPVLAGYITGQRGVNLHASGDSAFVFVTLRPGYGMSTVGGFLASKYTIGRPNGLLTVYGEIKRTAIFSLASQPGVSHIYSDVRIGFDGMKPDPGVYAENLASDMYRVREIIGADRVNQLGVTGRGVTIAIVDTGTDFAIPDLQQAVARDDQGRAISFDPDGQGFVITSLVVHRVGDVLGTSGMSVDVWNAASYTTTSIASSSVQSVKLNVDYGAPSVVSKSGNYHFGILREQIQDVISSQTVNVDFPVVVVDSATANVYDTVVVDMSTAYYNFLNETAQILNSEAADTLRLGLEWPMPQQSWNDHSFADEAPHKTGTSDLMSFDPDGDGVPDFSAGLLAFGIDLAGRTGGYYSLLPPIDQNGNFVNVFFDFESHGTSTASTAASRGILKRDIYQNGTLISLPGIAPAAKIMGVKALWLGDVTFGWYYAAGFDWNPNDLSFKYTGNHRADIISNSWGDSNSIWDLGSTFGSDYMSQLADAFSLPHYLDPAYPGTIMVIAAGNGGFGYGTTTSPAASTLAITVGASTSYAYRVQPGLKVTDEVAGSYDDVVPWSGRGPTSLGEPKPDVVDIGAFGFADQSLFTGYGNGTEAYTVFSGTSMATPVTAGALALLVQEYRDTHGGETPSPDLAKSILASTAHDLDYDPFSQGSGRVDIYSAMGAAAEGKDTRFPEQFYIESPATWDSSRALIANSWGLNMQSALPDESMQAANWFAGVVSPGSSASATFNLFNAVSPQAESYVFDLIGTKSYSNFTSGGVSWLTLSKGDIPQSTDLMKVTLVYRFTDFINSSTYQVDNASSYQVNNLLIAQLYNVAPDGSISRITNGAPTSTTSELIVGRPLDKFTGTPKVRVLLQGSSSSVPFGVTVRYYQKIPWSWVAKLDLTASKLTASIHVPPTSLPGAYEGIIEVKDGNSTSIIPVSVVVPILAAGRIRGLDTGSPYNNYAVYGGFDWSWRYEAGDWRTFAIIVPNGVHKIGVSVTWSDPYTDIQVHLTSPTGYLVASSDYPVTENIGNGKFLWYTSTGGSEEDIFTGGAVPGLYLLVLHNTLYGGSSFNYREPFVLNISFQ